MILIERLIDELKKFPPGSYCYAYEGEVTGIVVITEDRKHLGYVPAHEGEQDVVTAEFG